MTKTKEIICPYCERKATPVKGYQLYPHRKDLKDRNFWACWECDAYVGTHNGSNVPLGRLANKTLRAVRIKAHNAFDSIWKNEKMNRSDAYKWLADRLNIEPNKCHIGSFGIETCYRILSIMEDEKPNG